MNFKDILVSILNVCKNLNTLKIQGIGARLDISNEVLDKSNIQLKKKQDELVEGNKHLLGTRSINTLTQEYEKRQYEEEVFTEELEQAGSDDTKRSIKCDLNITREMRNNTVTDILSSKNALDDEAKRLTAANQFLVDRNANWWNRYERLKMNDVFLEKEINKTRSLIDDYANPSLEQPSYMDPED